MLLEAVGKIEAMIRQFGSTRLRWRYSTRSGPGLVLVAERSFWRIWSAVGGLNRDSSISVEGTMLFKARLRAVVSQGFAAKILVKKASASVTEPEKAGESSDMILRAARFLEWR